MECGRLDSRFFLGIAEIQPLNLSDILVPAVSLPYIPNDGMYGAPDFRHDLKSCPDASHPGERSRNGAPEVQVSFQEPMYALRMSMQSYGAVATLATAGNAFTSWVTMAPSIKVVTGNPCCC